jgi:hypothetical protein
VQEETALRVVNGGNRFVEVSNEIIHEVLGVVVRKLLFLTRVQMSEWKDHSKWLVLFFLLFVLGLMIWEEDQMFCQTYCGCYVVGCCAGWDDYCRGSV